MHSLTELCNHAVPNLDRLIKIKWSTSRHCIFARFTKVRMSTVRSRSDGSYHVTAQNLWFHYCKESASLRVNITYFDKQTKHLCTFCRSIPRGCMVWLSWHNRIRFRWWLQ